MPTGQGSPFDCRIYFFTLRLGIILNTLAYRDAIAQGSGRLGRLLSQIKLETNFPEPACDVSPVEAIVTKKLSDRYNFLTWMLQYLTFISLPAELNLPLTFDRCISILIDMHTIGHFFEIERLQHLSIAGVGRRISALLASLFLITTEGCSGPAQFRQPNIRGLKLLEETADAVRRAAGFVPATSALWYRTARFFLAMRHVIDFIDGGDRVTQQILRLARIGPFSQALATAGVYCLPAGLEGVFQTAMDWDLQHADCACAGCSNIIWRGDLVKRTPVEIDAGKEQKFALVNPFDGFKTVFCDYCRRHCGVPWDDGNKPCVPHV
ncbi:hypothetical protein SLS63_003967 [Diaporthe eres]|uniref:Uncharacterized protein n=1 Tax=Diaporthe eres TaxID=83184 RepID=A0ABR1PFI5_DIAER